MVVLQFFSYPMSTRLVCRLSVLGEKYSSALQNNARMRSNTIMSAPKNLQPNPRQTVINRFVAACQSDERVVAAFLGGSYARDTADTYSDLDLYLITTDESYDDFFADREAFIRQLGE